MKFTRGVLLLALAFSAALAFRTAAPSDEKKPPHETEAIRKSSAALAAAYNARDAKAVAAQFTPAGEFVDGSGNVFHGRAAIEAEFAALFKANPHGRVGIKPESIRIVALGVATEDGTASLVAVDDLPAANIGYVAVHVKQGDGKWLVASVRSLGEDETTPAKQLQQLAWLIGDWIEETDDSVVRTSTRWSEDGNFILSDFTVQVAKNRVLRGTQRIGWDPRSGKPKSWVFDSAGGHAEGSWTQVGDRWVVDLTGVRADGAVGTATNIYTPTGPDALTWESVDRVVGDRALPDLIAKIVRKPPEPKKSK